MEEGKEVVSMEEANGENGEGINKYACGCAAVASMISIIFGYDTYVFLQDKEDKESKQKKFEKFYKLLSKQTIRVL